MTRELFSSLTQTAIDSLDVAQARKEVQPFVKNTEVLEIWSRSFFRDVVQRIILV